VGPDRREDGHGPANPAGLTVAQVGQYTALANTYRTQMEELVYEHPPAEQKITQEFIADLRPLQVKNIKVPPELATSQRDPLPYKGVLKPGEDPLYRSRGVLNPQGKVMPRHDADQYVDVIRQAYAILNPHPGAWTQYIQTGGHADWDARGWRSFVDWCDENELGRYGLTVTNATTTGAAYYMDTVVSHAGVPPRIAMTPSAATTLTNMTPAFAFNAGYAQGIIHRYQTTMTVNDNCFREWLGCQDAHRHRRREEVWKEWNVLYEETREQLEARVQNELETERRRRREAEERVKKAEIRAKLEKEARIRAELLLMEFLDPQQRADLIERNYFQMKTGKGNVYRIYRGAHANVYRLNDKGESIENLCAQPPNLPAEDVMLVQMLALQNDEEGYRKNAGISRIDPKSRIEQERQYLYAPPPHRAARLNDLRVA